MIARFISVLLAFCVIATAGMTANLRVDTGTGQFATICAGGQSVTVELDHSGAPVETRHHCPDCIGMAVLGAQTVAPLVTLIETTLAVTTLAPSQTANSAPKASARAPPLAV